MELLKEFEKIQLLVDDKNNVRDFNITAKKVERKISLQKISWNLKRNFNNNF
ncbi:MAG: hypothetical protein IJ727_02560 [Treponema sp.]|nr:hypothetical protein [Treponema sp.]